MIDKVNAMFGTDITVELSGAWRAEVTAFENESGENSIDNSADDPDSSEEQPEQPEDREEETDDDKTDDESN